MSSESLPYVNDASFRTAQEFENRLRGLPAEAGVIFVGVSAVPIQGGVCKTFSIVLGLDRKFEEETGHALLKKVFEREIQDGKIGVNARVFRGSPGAAGYSALPVSHSASA